MPLTPEQAFKVGFLLRCADEGLTQDEINQRVKTAAAMPLMTKSAIIDRIISAVPPLLTGTGILAASLGTALPVLGGAGAGYTAAKLTSDTKDDVEQAKQDEITGEYYRLAEEAKRNAARKRLQKKTGRRITPLAPTI